MQTIDKHTEESLETLKITLHKIKLMEKILSKPTLANFVLKRVMRPLAWNDWSKINKGFRYSFFHVNAGLASKEEINGFHNVYQAKHESIEKLITYVRQNKPVVWFQWSVSRQLINGFDVGTLTPESFVRIGYGIEPEHGYQFLNAAENESILLDGCSSQRAAMGAMLINHIPKPTLIVATTHPCDSGVTIYQDIEYYYKDVPVFIFDTPYDRSKDSITYYAEQYRQLIALMEEKTHQKLNWDKLKASVEEFNKFSQLAYELSQMARAVPCPCSPTALMNLWEMRGSSTGHILSTSMAQHFYNAAKARLDKGQGFLKKEKIRILWWDIPSGFITLASWLERTFGAIIIADYLTTNPVHQVDLSSEQSILEGLALIDLYHGMSRQTHGTMELITDEMYEAIDHYSPSCIIINRHAGCLHAKALTRILKDISTKTGLPTLILNMDIFDPRVITEKDIKNTLTEFFKSNNLA